MEQISGDMTQTEHIRGNVAQMVTICQKMGSKIYEHMFPIEKEFEVTKGVIRIRKQKKDRQHSDQKVKDKKIKQ